MPEDSGVEAGGWAPGELVVEPCDQLIELSLAQGGRLLFLSDLHFTEPGPLADFKARKALQELLESVRRHRGQVIVALGGDVLDLLQLHVPRDQAAGHALAGQDAVALGTALRRIAERPDATVVYLAGNHDAALAWHGDSRRKVVEQLAVDHFALRMRVRIEGPDGGEVGLVAEHGDALDLYNRRSDPFDPLDSPAGDHIVTELVTRMDAATLRRPDLALDQVNNVRPTSMVPTWMVANFFYRFLSRALGDVALPLAGLFVLLHVPVVAAVGSGLLGRLGPVGTVSGVLVRWALLIAAIDLILLAVVFAFVGRSLRQAVSAYGAAPADLSGPPVASGGTGGTGGPGGTPGEAGEGGTAGRERAADLLTSRDPAARILLHGHSHQASFSQLDRDRVVVDSGCWIRALVPVRAWFGLPPVFVPAYPCTWVQVDAAADGAEVALWERQVATTHRVYRVERLLARGRLPATDGQAARVIASARVVYASSLPTTPAQE